MPNTERFSSLKTRGSSDGGDSEGWGWHSFRLISIDSLFLEVSCDIGLHDQLKLTEEHMNASKQ